VALEQPALQHGLVRGYVATYTFIEAAKSRIFWELVDYFFGDDNVDLSPFLRQVVSEMSAQCGVRYKAVTESSGLFSVVRARFLV
jgi:hypothetical protein